MLNLLGSLLTEIAKLILKPVVKHNLSVMFAELNSQIGGITGSVAKTPDIWNADVFAFIRQLSENVMMPIAGMIISAVLSYELITVAIDKNNMHDFDTGLFFRFLFKSCIAVLLLSKTFDMTMAFFDVGRYLVDKATASITGISAVDYGSQLKAAFEAQYDTFDFGELLEFTLETTAVTMAMRILSIIISVVLYGRMIEIYMYISIAPIPFATLTNREWGQMGTNYLKAIAALALQGFFIVICVGIYAVLVRSLSVSSDVSKSMRAVFCFTVVLCFSLMKTGSFAKSITGAH